MKRVIIVLLSFIVLMATFLIVGQQYTIDRSELFDYTKMNVEQIDLSQEEGLSKEELDSLLVKPGTLLVGTSPDYAPYSFLDLEMKGLSRVQGAESAIAYHVAQSLGLKLEFKEIKFELLTQELQMEEIDVIFSGLTYEGSREQYFKFTDTYYQSGDGGQVLVTLKDNLSKFNGIDDINKSSVKIAAQDASLQFKLVEEQLPNATIQKFAAIDAGVTLLNGGNVDMLASSRTSAEALLAVNPNFVIIETFEFSAVDYGTMGLLNKENPLVDYLNLAINNLEEGSYEVWLEDYKEYAQVLSDLEGLNFIQRLFSISARFSGQFAKGTATTVILSLITVVCGTTLATLVLFLRKSGIKVLEVVGNVYVEVIRGVPLLLQLFIITIVLPLPLYMSICIALIINSGAYVSEIIRAGIEGVDKGQYEACRSLGLSRVQTMKKVIIPQAIRKISPALGNEFVMLIKETSLASVFYIGDLMTIKNVISSITYLSLEPYIVIGVIYFVITFCTSDTIKYFEKKMEA